MKTLPSAARIFVGLIIGVGGLLLIGRFPFVHFEQLSLFVILLVLSAATSTFKVNLPLAKSVSTMSVSYAVDFAALLLLGADQAMLVGSFSAWSQCTFRMKEPNPIYRTLFSMASLVIAVQAAGAVYAYFGGVPGTLAMTQLLSTEFARPLVGAATAYFIVNTAAVAAAIGLSTRQSVLTVWHENFLWSAPSYFVGAAVAAIAAMVLGSSGYWLVPLTLAPLYLTYRSYKVYLGRVEDEQRHVKQISDLHLATIEALALAIDAKDQTSQTHIRRVQAYAASMGRAVGMSENEIQGVKTAALLHDIGKLAVPEHILNKPGPLTPEEFQKIRAHPAVGAAIISAVPFPYPVAPLILNHHERWDGRGYPHGLVAEQIPLGARILSVVDYFDAIMTDRPYHKAMSYDAALTLLKQEAGHALDPTLVEKFIEILPALNDEVSLSENNVRRLDPIPHYNEPVPLVGKDAEPKQQNVFADIALAHREIYALYEIAQAMGSSLGVADTMALISSKLSNLVPYSCCALFLFDEEADSLSCRFAIGTDAEVIQQLNVRSGEGLTGWVARNRRALLNARPGADLEAAGSPLTTQLQSALVCPLVFGDRFIGTLSVYHTEPMFYRDDHRRLLDRVSEQASAVIHNSMVFEQTQEDSLTDALTSLPNTRFLFMHLTRELARSERLKVPLALLVMDVDNFKEINDTHGHHVGDLALTEVARVLRKEIRPYDICVRYAGDEFIVVLAGCPREEAEAKRLELQNAVDEIRLEIRPGRFLSVGISIGAAVFPDGGQTYQALLATADGKMYQDKAKRKRRTNSPSRSEGAVDARAADVSDVDVNEAAAGVL